MERPAAPATWFVLVTGAMRAGYAARGFVYCIVGLIALGAAASDTEAAGLLESLGRLKDAPWNEPVLVALAAGLVGYAIWRGLDAAIDLAGHGPGFGWVERGGLAFVSLLHLALAWYSARLALGGASFAVGSRNRAAEIVSALIGDAIGRGFVVLVGVGTVSFGCYSIWKGALSGYRRHMRQTRALERLAPLLGFGLIARGIVMGIMGGFIVWAAWTLDPNVAGGYGETLKRIRDAVHGRVLLGVTGTGMIAFSFYCFCEAVFRVIPPRQRDHCKEAQQSRVI
jgi:hypothetical protein